MEIKCVRTFRHLESDSRHMYVYVHVYVGVDIGTHGRPRTHNKKMRRNVRF